MWPFLRKNRLNDEIDELASAIYDVAMTSSGTYQNFLQILDNELKGVNREVAVMELINLRQFAAVYAAQRFLRGDDVKQRAREVFIGIFHRQLKEATPTDAQGDPNMVIDVVNSRLNLYGDAMSVAESANPLWNIGRVFCKLCTGEEPTHLEITLAGSIEFGAVLKSVTDYLCERKKTDKNNLIDI